MKNTLENLGGALIKIDSHMKTHNSNWQKGGVLVMAYMLLEKLSGDQLFLLIMFVGFVFVFTPPSKLKRLFKLFK